MLYYRLKDHARTRRRRKFLQQLQDDIHTTWMESIMQPSLFDEAHARTTDPQTSHDAAHSIPGDNIRKSQQAVHRILQLIGPMHDQQLIETYSHYHRRDNITYPRQSESGIRTRRKELVTKGLIENSGDTVLLSSGRKSIIWQVRA